MVSILEAIVLGIIQGITEWLPVSSSGHLVIAQELFGMSVPLVFDIALHVGTMLVIFVVFWEDVKKIITSVFRLDFKSAEGRLAWFIVIGSVPTALIGFLFSDFFESLFTNLMAVGLALVATGLLLFVSERWQGKKKLDCRGAFIIGIAQGLAIIPGISRSGTTISIGMLLGVEKKTVAKFSFLLAVPAIIGAALFKANDLLVADVEILSLVVGVVVSMVVGYLSLKWLLGLIIRKKFHYFAYYCWAAGIIVLLLGI